MVVLGTLMEGWCAAENGSKDHFFRQGDDGIHRSLCGAHTTMHQLYDDTPDETAGDKAPSYDCGVCWRRRKRERVRQEVQARNERKRAQ